MVDLRLLDAAIKLLLKRVPPVSGLQTEESNSWAWIETRTRPLLKEIPIRLASIRVSNCQCRLSLSTRCREILSVRTTWGRATRTMGDTAVWCSRRPTFMNSQLAASKLREQSQPLVCLETLMTTSRWIDSAPKYRSAKTSTRCLQVTKAIKAVSSKHLTTSWSKRNNSITKWWLKILRIASKC